MTSVRLNEVQITAAGTGTEDTEIGKRIQYYLEMAAENLRTYGQFPEGFRDLKPEVLIKLAAALSSDSRGEADLGLASRMRRASLTLTVSSLLASLGQASGVFEIGRFRLIRPTYEALVEGLQKVVAALPLDFASARSIQRDITAAELPPASDKAEANNRAAVIGFLRRGLDPLTAHLQRLLATRGLERRPEGAGPPGASRGVGRSFSDQSDSTTRLLSSLDPRLEGRLYPALANASVGRTSSLRRVGVLRVTALPFGATAPREVIETRSVANGDTTTTTTGVQEWRLAEKAFAISLPIGTDFRAGIVTLSEAAGGSSTPAAHAAVDVPFMEGILA